MQSLAAILHQSLPSPIHILDPGSCWVGSGWVGLGWIRFLDPRYPRPAWVQGRIRVLVVLNPPGPDPLNEVI